MEPVPPTPPPPVGWAVARNTLAAGAAAIAVAAALGLVDPSAGVVGTVRVWLTFAGAVAVGVGVWLRSDVWQAWAIAAAAAAVGVAATPAHWDSFRLLFAALAAAAVFRLAVTAAPPGWRLGLVSAYLLFHFGGIFSATTAPQPTPWLVDQVYHRVYNQYLQFIYLRNAYHFYSPEPGPASLLACLVKTEVGTEADAVGQTRKKYETRWVVLPRRPADIRDPLGLSYFRRLSITEQLVRGAPDFTSTSFEKSDVRARRVRRTVPGTEPYYPFHPTEPEAYQYRLPAPEVTRFYLPSYAQHLILELTPDAETAARTTIKLYRIEHRTLPVEALIGVGGPTGQKLSPYSPLTYRPFFLGEYRPVSADPANPYKPRVELVNPKDDMLYWLLPVLPDPEYRPNGGKKEFVDYMSAHAGLEFNWSQLR